MNPDPIPSWVSGNVFGTHKKMEKKTKLISSKCQQDKNSTRQHRVLLRVLIKQQMVTQGKEHEEGKK